MGPYHIICQTQGGLYILEEMDACILRHHIVGFRLIPYVLRQDIDAWANGAGSESATDSLQEASENVDQENAEIP